MTSHLKPDASSQSLSGERSTSAPRVEVAYLESTFARLVGALRAGREMPDVERMRRDLYRIARTVIRMNDSRAKTWASAKLEETRRRALATVGADHP